MNEQIAHFFNLEKYREPGIACINFIRPPKHAIRPVVFDGQSSMPLIKNQVIYCRFIANIADAELLDDIALQPGTGMPSLNKMVGSGWVSGELSVHQEHLYSVCVRDLIAYSGENSYLQCPQTRHL